MNCQTCGKPLPTEVAFCPSCGAATPYNTSGQNAASPYAPNAPTFASPYGPSPSAQNPYTGYGAAGIPQDPYSNTPPPSHMGSAPQQNLYAPPASSPSGPYNYNIPGTQGYVPGVQPGTYIPNKPPRGRSKVGFIIGAVVLGLVLVCGGLVAVVAAVSRSTPKTPTISTTTLTPTSGTTPTATSTPTSSVPTSSDISSAASKIIFNVQTSSAIDKDDNPSKVTTSFTAGQTVYLTFQDDTLGKDGFIQVKWYKDGALVNTKLLKHSAQNNIGYFPRQYNESGAGAAAIYWCIQSTCSDAQLAQISSFTITAAAAVPNNHPAITATLYDKRRID